MAESTNSNLNGNSTFWYEHQIYHFIVNIIFAFSYLRRSRGQQISYENASFPLFCPWYITIIRLNRFGMSEIYARRTKYIWYVVRYVLGRAMLQNKNLKYWYTREQIVEFHSVKNLIKTLMLCRFTILN